jgi:hypothetical protein
MQGQQTHPSGLDCGSPGEQGIPELISELCPGGQPLELDDDDEELLLDELDDEELLLELDEDSQHSQHSYSSVKSPTYIDPGGSITFLRRLRMPHFWPLSGGGHGLLKISTGGARSETVGPPPIVFRSVIAPFESNHASTAFNAFSGRF